MGIQRRMKKAAKEAKELITSYCRERKVNVEFFSFGATMINLAISGSRKHGVPRARVTNLVGDGSSGKTLLAIEASFSFLKSIPKLISKIFGKHKKPKVIYNNGEGVMDFPLEKMYGKKFVDSIDWRRSKTIEAVGRDYLSECGKLKDDEALLYIIDSWDSFRSVHDSKILKEKDEDIIKGYNLKKQQYAWKFFADVCEVIERNVDATLIVISQTKLKIGVTFGKKRYRTGGDALNFYTHLVPWIRVVKTLVKTKKKEKRVYGIHGEIKIERSKVGLCFRSSEFILLFDYGIDDIGSMALYLKQRGKKNWKGIPLEDIHKFSVEIEKRKLKGDLSKYIEKIWQNIEQSFQDEVDERKRKEL